MDWSIPSTFYPMALPAAWMWTLFSLVVASTIVATWVAIGRRGLWRGLLLSVPIAIVSLLTSMLVSMVITFFTHDI